MLPVASSSFFTLYVKKILGFRQRLAFIKFFLNSTKCELRKFKLVLQFLHSTNSSLKKSLLILWGLKHKIINRLQFKKNKQKCHVSCFDSATIIPVHFHLFLFRTNVANRIDKCL